MACPNNFAPHFDDYHYGSSPSLPAPATAGDELLHGPAALHINKINKDVKTRSEKVHKRGNACFSRSSRCSTRSCKHIRLHNFPSFSGGLGLMSQLGLTPCLHLFGMPFDVSCIISSEPSTLRSQLQCRPQCFAVAGLCLVTDLQDGSNGSTSAQMRTCPGKAFSAVAAVDLSFSLPIAAATDAEAAGVHQPHKACTRLKGMVLP